MLKNISISNSIIDRSQITEAKQITPIRNLEITQTTQDQNIPFSKSLHNLMNIQSRFHKTEKRATSKTKPFPKSLHNLMKIRSRFTIHNLMKNHFTIHNLMKIHINLPAQIVTTQRIDKRQNSGPPQPARLVCWVGSRPA